MTGGLTKRFRPARIREEDFDDRMQTQGLHLDFFIATLLPEWWEKVAYILDATVITLGGTTFTIGRILYVIVLVLLLVWMTGIFKRRVIATLLERTSMDVHSRKASTTLVETAMALT